MDLPRFRGHKDKPVLDGKDVSNGYKGVAEAAEPAEIVKGFDTSVSENPVSNYAAASSVDGRLIQTSPGSFLQTG